VRIQPQSAVPGPAVRYLANHDEAKYSIIAMGASAGGLEAITTILQGLPADFRCPIVIVIHQHPSFVSHAAEILGRCTALHVKEATQSEHIQPGVVYLAPPNLHLLVAGGAVQLTRTAVVHFTRPSVDTMFASVAAGYGPRCIGVILSGSGRDGADGLSAIKSAGGFTIVQDALSARFKSMPAAAMAQASADRSVPSKDIAALLAHLATLPAESAA
jgi:two-component system chemotaxis response regulator CheB